MTFDVWIAFTIAVGFILLVPGPSVLVIVSYALAYGRQASVWLILAVVLGNALAFIVAFVGLGGVAAVSPEWVQGFQIVAGIYLLVLAVKLFRVNPVRLTSDVYLVSVPHWKLLCNTCLITVFSPTVVVFFMSALPGFLSLNRSVVPQFLILFLTVVFLSFLKGIIYTWFTTWGRGLLSSPVVMRRCNVVSALVMIAAGIWAISGSWVDQKIPDPKSVSSSDSRTPSRRLAVLIEQRLGDGARASLLIPDSDDFKAIPQDTNNQLTTPKVALGKMLFHDTAFALDGRSGMERAWSCSTCHHSTAGFKAGIPQGIGEGGTGFGFGGTERVLADGFDGNAADDAANRPDIQPLATPTILNTAFQNVMLWNGQFGNDSKGSANGGLPLETLAPAGTPKHENRRGLSGLETQAIAGFGVHRIDVTTDTPLQNNYRYRELWLAAYGNTATHSDVLSEAGKAIAAYQRTVLANRSPFQFWLRGDATAMSNAEIRGAELFFGKAGCIACHQGPALSSKTGASEEEIFFAIGFQDFDTSDPRIHGSVTEADSKGRGGFTKNSNHYYQFKVPQLYNLADYSVFGHGASFGSIREVLEYKNRAAPQNPAASSNLDHRFTPLGLSYEELNDLETFLSDALYDPDLERYEPQTVPSGRCAIVEKTVCLTSLEKVDYE